MLLFPALWSAVVAMSPVAIHPCGGMEHGSSVAADAATDPHAHHAAPSDVSAATLQSSSADDAPGRSDVGSCECVDCGAPTAATSVPTYALGLVTVSTARASVQWPASARGAFSATDHALPFANGPPQG